MSRFLIFSLIFTHRTVFYGDACKNYYHIFVVDVIFRAAHDRRWGKTHFHKFFSNVIKQYKNVMKK